MWNTPRHEKIHFEVFQQYLPPEYAQVQRFAATGNSDALKGDKWRVVETPLFERKNDFPPVMYFMIENVK